MIPENILKQINEKVIEYAKENTPKQVTMPAFHDGALFGYRLAAQFSNQLGWVKAEIMPEKSGYYICWMKGNEPGLIHYHTDTGWQNGFYDDLVTHWTHILPPSPINTGGEAGK